MHLYVDCSLTVLEVIGVHWLPAMNRTELMAEPTPPPSPLAANPSEGEPGGGEPPSPEPDPDAEPTEPDPAGANHGEQGDVPRGAETVHVSESKTFTLTGGGKCFSVLH